MTQRPHMQENSIPYPPPRGGGVHICTSLRRSEPRPQKSNPRSNVSIVMPKASNNQRKELARHLEAYKEITVVAQFNFCADPHSFARAV